MGIRHSIALPFSLPPEDQAKTIAHEIGRYFGGFGGGEYFIKYDIGFWDAILDTWNTESQPCAIEGKQRTSDSR